MLCGPAHWIDLGRDWEKRFIKVAVFQMMEDAGLKNVSFSNSKPYWCAVGV